jgi:hypothetical protein
VASVGDVRALGDAAALPDLDRRVAGDDHVVRQVRAGADRDPPVGADFGPEAAAELDPGADDEAAAVRHVEAEARTEVDRPLEADVGLGVAQKHPPLAQGGHEARPPVVADRDRQTVGALAQGADEGGHAPPR